MLALLLLLIAITRAQEFDLDTQSVVDYSRFKVAFHEGSTPIALTHPAHTRLVVTGDMYILALEVTLFSSSFVEVFAPLQEGLSVSAPVSLYETSSSGGVVLVSALNPSNTSVSDWLAVLHSASYYNFDQWTTANLREVIFKFILGSNVLLMGMVDIELLPPLITTVTPFTVQGNQTHVEPTPIPTPHSSTISPTSTQLVRIK